MVPGRDPDPDTDPDIEAVAAQAAVGAAADGRGEAVEAALAMEAAEPLHNLMVK